MWQLRLELEFGGVLVRLWGGACLIPSSEALKGQQDSRGKAVTCKDREPKVRASQVYRCVVGVIRSGGRWRKGRREGPGRQLRKGFLSRGLELQSTALFFSATVTSLVEDERQDTDKWVSHQGAFAHGRDPAGVREGAGGPARVWLEGLEHLAHRAPVFCIEVGPSPPSFIFAGGPVFELQYIAVLSYRPS